MKRLVQTLLDSVIREQKTRAEFSKGLRVPHHDRILKDHYLDGQRDILETLLEALNQQDTRAPRRAAK